LYRSRLRFFAGKLLSKWEGPYVIEEVYRLGVIKIASLKDDTTQVVNGQRLKHYRDFYFRALGSLVVLSFPQLLSFSSVFPKPLSETLTRSSDGRNPVQLTVPG
jgi:hypothetical protein